MTSNTYRSDIDGLRAVAIILVLMFHGGVSFFPSGFIGVDIFFVISGFLITGIIHHSLKNKNFSFSEFYKRRLWRLQPVFISLLLITAVLTFIFYLPEDLQSYFRSARKTSLFLSNTYFERFTNNYFAPDNTQLPLLHTWSLAIEWQCYLILPLIIVLAHRFLKEEYFTKFIYWLSLLFLILALSVSYFYPEKTYYLLISRIFEFLIGSCVALNPQRLTFNQLSANVIGFSALSILIFIAMNNQVQLGFPNFYALVLCIATATLILIGQNETPAITKRFLSLPVMVFIGLISYSLYIWHWPVFVLMRYLNVVETPLKLIGAFALIFTLALLSWRFIEKPARQGNRINFIQSFLFLFIFPSLTIHLADKIVKKRDGYPQRFAEALHINKQLRKFNSPLRELCLQEGNNPISKTCHLGSTQNRAKKALMIGDSYANHYWRFMDVLAKAANLSVISHETAACLTVPELKQYDWNQKIYTACHKQTQRYFRMIEKNHYDYVILGAHWGRYIKENLVLDAQNKPYTKAHVKQKISDALERALEKIIASGAQPILLKSISLDGYNPHTCFYNHIKHHQKYFQAQCDFNLKTRGYAWQESLFSQMTKKYPQLIIISPELVQCPNGLCKAEFNGIPIYKDAGHIYDHGSYHLGKLYLEHYPNPLS